MDIRRFRIFQAVAQEKSFTKAAQKLYMTQPAVSKAIHELEEELQLPLFERFPKKTIMTPVGEQFLQQVQQLLQLYRQHETGCCFVTGSLHITNRLQYYDCQ